MAQPTMNAIRAIFRREVTNRDHGEAFEDDSYALFHARGGGISVVAARPSKDPKRGRDMAAYAEVLEAAQFKVETTKRGDTITTLKVVPS